jgi:hypothetical protein
MHFFRGVPGDGLFVRADIGVANLASRMKEVQGLGVQLGCGYGVPLSDEMRILLQTGYVYRRMGGGDYATWSMTVGCLF